jgi:hypothetical protein
MKNRAFSDLTSCGSCKKRRFGGTHWLQHKGDKNGRARNNVSSANAVPVLPGTHMVPLATVMFRLLNTWFGFRFEPYCLKAWRTQTACWRLVHSVDCWVCRLRGDARTSGEGAVSGRSGVALASLQHTKHNISAYLRLWDGAIWLSTDTSSTVL